MKKGYFAVSTNSINRIVKNTGRAEHIMAFLVLSSHSQEKDKFNRQLTAAGVKAVHKNLGITYNKASLFLNDLVEDQTVTSRKELGSEEECEIPKYFGKGTSQNREIRYILPNPIDAEVVWLSNCLVHGIGDTSRIKPLEQILRDAKIGPCSDIHETRLDTITLLIHLYRHQSILDFGGIDPKCLHRQ